MTDWPDAPRLTDTLNRLADEVDTNTPSRIETEQMLRAREAARVDDIVLTTDESDAPIIVPFRQRPEAPPSRDFLHAIAAAVVIAVGVVIVLLVRDPDPNRGTADDTAVVQPQPSVATAPPPELAHDELCQAGGLAPSARVVETSAGPIEIGVARSATASGFAENLSIVAVGASLSWEEIASQQAIEQTSGLGDVTAFYVPGGINETQTADVLASIDTERCGGLTYLVASGAVGDSTLCPSTSGYAGYGLINPGPPPTTCELFQPTVLMTTIDGPATADWEAHFRCVDGTTRLDDMSNEITSYGTCETTLTTVRSATPDVWSTTIDSMTTTEFLAQVVTTPK